MSRCKSVRQFGRPYVFEKPHASLNTRLHTLTHTYGGVVSMQIVRVRQCGLPHFAELPHTLTEVRRD
jgi:hypothetical protein